MCDHTGMSQPVETDEPQTNHYPSRIIMLDAAGELTEDPDQAKSGEVIETLPDGSERYTSFTA